MQQSGFGLLLFVGAPAGRETGCPEHSAGKPNGLPGNLFCRATCFAGQPVLPGNRIAGKRPRPYNIRVPESSA